MEKLRMIHHAVDVSSRLLLANATLATWAAMRFALLLLRSRIRKAEAGRPESSESVRGIFADLRTSAGDSRQK